MKKAKKITTPTGKPVKAKGPTGHATKIGRTRADGLPVDNHYKPTNAWIKRGLDR